MYGIFKFFTFMFSSFLSMINYTNQLVKRILKSLLEILVWLDEGAGLILSIPFYLAFGHPKPDATKTISAIVGHYATREYLWAILAEWVIDRFFYIFERRLGHCRRFSGDKK